MSEVLPAYFSENIEASYVQFDLSLSSGDQVDKVQLEAIRIRGGKEDKKGIVKDVTLPVSGLKVTATEVLAALNIPHSDFFAGDLFNLYVLTTKGGQTTRSIAAVGIPVVCFFEPSMLVGDYYYVSASWEEEGDVVLEADPNDPYKIYISGMAETQGAASNGNKILLEFNANNFSITGPNSIISDSFAGYTNYGYRPVSGKFDSCSNTYTITFAITVAQGSFGNFAFVFEKK
jgi:hypothetical protein